jgi:short-subunit dehydrogenase
VKYYCVPQGIRITKILAVLQVLVNNAGISSHGESLDMSLDEVLRMIQVNTIAVTSLTHLFGRDMKERRRGRILLVSSVCGAVSGIATVAVYAATKAYENSFGAAIGKELEPYGVGVTCLMPGAVRGTEFRSRSNSQEAMCWKIPFYSKTPSAVAECGVRAMLRGDTEVMPGVLNRLFVKVVKPILPQRMHNLLAEFMWNPLQLPFRPKVSAKLESLNVDTMETSRHDSNRGTPDITPDVPHQRPIVVRPMLYFSDPPSPRLLTLDDLSADNPEAMIDTQGESEDLTSDKSLATDEIPSENNADATTETSVDDNIGDGCVVLESKPERQRTPSESNGTSATSSRHQIGTERMESKFSTPKGPLKAEPSSELDLLMDQYKKHRALSIEDPWSTGFHHRYKYNGDPLPPSLIESRQNIQEV